MSAIHSEHVCIAHQICAHLKECCKIDFFLVVFTNCRTPKLLQQQVVRYLLIKVAKNLLVLKYFSPYLSVDEKRNSAFF